MAKATTPAKPTPSQKATQQTAAKAQSQTNEPKVVYPEVKFEIFKDGISAEKAKQLLGWETEADYIAKLKTVDANLNEDEAKTIFAKDKFLTDMLGNNIALRANTHNRPWGEAVTNAYMQDLLMRHWEFNGETIIIGKYGHVLSGQHRLIGLVFAEQKRTKEDEQPHWESYWQSPVTMPCCIVYGIDESSKVTRTIDNVKSRTLTDVICADTDLFGGIKVTERKSVARALEYAVKFLWERIGVGDTDRDSWAPKRTHSEALAFVDRHAKIKECVRFIMDEERGSEGRISRFIYPGHAAALLYLQATAGMKENDIQDYCANRPLDEKYLKFPGMKKAKMFWSELAKASTSAGTDPNIVKIILASCPVTGNEPDVYTGRVFPIVIDDKRVHADGSFSEQLGTLIKAWNSYVKDESIDSNALQLGYNVVQDPLTGNNVFELIEFPAVAGSIDGGKKVKKAKPKKADATVPADGTVSEDGESLTDVLESGEENGENTPSESKTESKSDEKPVQTMREKWEDDKNTYGANHLLIYQSNLPTSNNWVIFYGDATKWKEVHPGAGVAEHQGVLRLVLDRKEVDRDAPALLEAGCDLLMMSRPDKDGNREITAYAPSEESTEPAPEQPAQKKVIITKKS